LATLTQQSELDTLLAALFCGTLTEAQATELAAKGPQVVQLALLAANARFAELQPVQPALVSPSPSTPSGMVPVYEKPPTRQRRKKPGAKAGHPGARRKTPEQIDQHVEHRLEVCPCCGGALQRCKRVRTRIVEDIPQDIKPVVTEHTIHRDYCPGCKKHVEPVVADAMPNAALGHHAVGLSSYFHYGLGLPISQVRDIFASLLKLNITAGGLLSAWNRMSEALHPWYEQIREQLNDTACLHADETGWRVDGQTHWLWCFCDKSSCYYLIDKSRGNPALQRFFEDAFRGTLVTDFWAVYDQVNAEDRQVCLPHLLRELLKVDQYNASSQWQQFAKQLRRLLRDGIRLRKRHDFDPRKYQSRILLLNKRLWALAEASYYDPDARRLAGRLSRYRDCIFTFLDKPEVPADNNHAERQIRPAVIQRKNILCNRSADGADTQATLMSIFRTLRLRGHDPTRTISEALQALLKTGNLPPLPGCAVAGG
jgi:transposase